MTSQPTTPSYQPAETTPMTPAQERSWATVSHVVPMVAMVVSAGVLGFIASLILYLAYKDRGPFVRQAAANSLNIQITTGIILLVSLPLMLLLVGFATFALAIVAAFVLHLIAALKANQGEWYTPPFTIRFVK